MVKLIDKKDKNMLIALGIVGLVVASWLFIKPWFEIKKVKEVVALELVDPESANFRNIHKVTLGYCGEVNAKNRMGGYIGFEQFHAFKTISTDEWDVSLEPSIVQIMCK